MGEEALKVHFATMAVEATAADLGIPPERLYLCLERAGIVKGLLFDCYDTLHSESLEGVVWNVKEALKSRGYDIELAV